MSLTPLIDSADSDKTPISARPVGSSMISVKLPTNLQTPSHMSEFNSDVDHKETSLISTLCGCSDGFMSFIIADDGSFNSEKTRIHISLKMVNHGSGQRKVAGLCGFKQNSMTPKQTTHPLSASAEPLCALS